MATLDMEWIGRFQVLRVLGEGGMGVVYVARDPNLSREVAIKTIHLTPLVAGESPESQRTRLFQEAKSAGMLRHPNIVTIYDVEESAGIAFIVMELVQGSTLHERVKARRLTWDETVRILSQIAEALDFAHQRGVIHRDVKPANIVLDQGDIVKLTDFGIAKICQRQAGEFTFKGCGTPLYMSPEQIQNSEITGQSDQFSLSVIAYQMLTGEVPFHGETEFGTMEAIASAPRPSAHRANPSLPPGVDEPLMRAMSISPGERFSSCREFVQALSLSLQPVETRNPVTKSVPTASKRTIRKSAPSKPGVSRWWAGLLAAMLVAAAAAFAYLYWRPQRAGISNSLKIISFSAEPHSIPVGGVITLRWNVSGASRVVIDGGVGQVGSSGTAEVVPKDNTYYTLSAYGAGTEVTAKSFISVQRANGTPRTSSPIRRLSSGSSKIVPGERTTSIQNPDNSLTGSHLNPGNGSQGSLNSGHEDAQALLDEGKTAYLGKGRKADSAEAAGLFTRAANLGSSEAMVLLGTMYTQGEGVPRDYAHAVRLFQQAANAGNARGMDNLAHMYADGYGVNRSLEQAAFWYKKAADLGDADATYHLGMLYENGNGVPRDRDQALRLYSRAAALGKQEATLRMKALSATANPQLALFSIEPSVIQAGQPRQYKLVGAGLSLDSLVFVDGASAVGSHLGPNGNHHPVEASSTGSWARIYIYLDPSSRLRSSTITVQSGSSRASLVVPVSER
jgi:serine/threonine protein kinase